MSAPTISTLVAQNLAGQLAAQQAIYDIRHGIAHQDLLHEHLKAALQGDEPERVRSFMRTLQKRLEALS